jgi:hypothetical protein
MADEDPAAGDAIDGGARVEIGEKAQHAEGDAAQEQNEHA